MAFAKVPDSELFTTDNAMVLFEVSDRESTPTEDLTASMALIKVSDSESLLTDDTATTAGPSTTAVVAAPRPLSLQALFQTLPTELREKVYFNLGYPIAGYVRHKCSDRCMVHFQHQLNILRMEFTHTYVRNGVPASWEEYASTRKILRIEAAGPKFSGLKVYITGKEAKYANDANNAGPLGLHMFAHQPDLGLLMANRWFHNDIMDKDPYLANWEDGKCKTIGG